MKATTEGMSRYDLRGVSASKPEVHAAVAGLSKGVFPGAFCTILPDILGQDPRFCNVMHADGAGTKTSLAYLAWKHLNPGTLEKLGVWKGIVCDSLFMNLDDVGCVGGLGPFLISSTIGRNKALIPGDVIASLIQGCQDICEWLSEMNLSCHFAGGETADIGDLVRTIVVDHTVTTRLSRAHVVDAGRISAPAFIVGFSSTGQAKWETVPNSGMGSNGLTNAKHDVLAPAYRFNKETYCPETNPNLVYCGGYVLDDELPGDPRFTIASALLSPTRTYLPLMKQLLTHIGHERILGLIHCSGGGQTKIGKFGRLGIKFRKDNLFPIPPLFKMLQEVRKLPPREMFQSYNMGHRLEAVVKTREDAEQCIAIATECCEIDARIVGEVVPFENAEKRQVEIVTDGGTFQYDFKA